MNFWNVLKYALMVVFVVILLGAVMVAPDSSTAAQQPVPAAGQSKFNF